MQAPDKFQVALLWRTDAEKPASTQLADNRLAQVAAALESVGLSVHGAPYTDQSAESVRQQLQGMHAVLVWVNPLEGDKDRTILNKLLRELFEQGVYVSAHPDLIQKMGTKEVLVRTRDMSWGTDTHLYKNIDEFRNKFPYRWAENSPRVLKRNRGSSGSGVWAVELADPIGNTGIDDSSQIEIQLTTRLKVRQATRGSADEIVTWSELVDRFTPYFTNSETVIDQPFQSRLAEGMTRCYMVNNKVVGFGHQQINALIPSTRDEQSTQAPTPGPPIPGARIYHGVGEAQFQPVKLKMEREWLPDLLATLDINDNELPVIWDADVMLGPKNQLGLDTYVLCEINVSSVYPFPDQALHPIAVETLRQLRRRIGR